MSSKRLWIEAAALLAIGAALALAAALSFSILKDSGLYPEVSELAMVAFWTSAVALVVVLGLAVRLLVDALRAFRG